MGRCWVTGQDIISEHCTVKSTLELGLSNQATRWNGINWLRWCFVRIARASMTVSARMAIRSVTVPMPLMLLFLGNCWLPIENPLARRLIFCGCLRGIKQPMVWLRVEGTLICGECYVSHRWLFMDCRPSTCKDQRESCSSGNYVISTKSWWTFFRCRGVAFWDGFLGLTPSLWIVLFHFRTSWTPLQRVELRARCRAKHPGEIL